MRENYDPNHPKTPQEPDQNPDAFKGCEQRPADRVKAIGRSLGYLPEEPKEP
jgi:hypothetical protein